MRNWRNSGDWLNFQRRFGLDTILENSSRARGPLLREPTDSRIHPRLAARDRHARRAALLHRPEALLDREVLAEDLRRVLDLAAPRAREVAAEEGLEHEDQRVARAAREPLLDDVARHRPHLRQRNAHTC